MLHMDRFFKGAHQSCVTCSGFSKAIHSHHIERLFGSPALVVSARLNFPVDLVLLLKLLLPDSEDGCEIKFLLFIKAWKFGDGRCSAVMADGIKMILY